MLKYARPALPVPNGSQPPLWARVSQAPWWNRSQLTALSVTKPASLLDMWFLSGWWSLSLCLHVSLSYFHTCIAILIRNHISYLRAFLRLLANPSLRMAGLMKEALGEWGETRGLGNRTQAPGLFLLVLISGSDMLLSSQLVFNSGIRM